MAKKLSKSRSKKASTKLPHANRGKKYRKAIELVDRTKSYPMAEAAELATKTAVTKFDSTVELHVRLDIDAKQSDQHIRSTMALPHGTGKKVIIAAFVDEGQLREAKEAGADFVGGEDLIDKVQKENFTAFDVAVTTPDMMRKMAKLGKILGTKGLMPNPKAGTVTPEIGKTIKELKGGRVEFRTDPTGIVHASVGKVSFGPEKIAENAKILVDAIKTLKPASIKGTFIKSVTLSTTMGPGIKVTL